MSLPDYEYSGLMAQAWDVLRGDTSTWEDHLFYLDAIKIYGQPVLDVGCGTGRLLLDYLQQGIDIDGVDNSPDMLAICRAKAAALGLHPNLSQQYMETLELPRTYQTILIPSSSLQLVIAPADTDRAMQRLVAHLNPGGALIASIMALWGPDDPLDISWEKQATRNSDGVTFRRVSRSIRRSPEAETEDTEELYQMLRDGKIIAEEIHKRAPATRAYTQPQARDLFSRAGLTNIQILHEFTWHPAKPDDTLFVIIGTKPKIA